VRRYAWQHAVKGNRIIRVPLIERELENRSLAMLSFAARRRAKIMAVRPERHLPRLMARTVLSLGHARGSGRLAAVSGVFACASVKGPYRGAAPRFNSRR
jgi:hypothetical protein